MRSLVQVLVALIGGVTLVTNLLMFFAPMWFFTNIAPFSPYNYHFIGDIGAFSAPMNVGLLIAARDPIRYRLLIGLAALGNLLHSLSHLRDWDLHMPPHMPYTMGITTEISIAIIGIILLAITGYCYQATSAEQ